MLPASTKQRDAILLEYMRNVWAVVMAKRQCPWMLALLEEYVTVSVGQRMGVIIFVIVARCYAIFDGRLMVAVQPLSRQKLSISHVRCALYTDVFYLYQPRPCSFAHHQVHYQSSAASKMDRTRNVPGNLPGAHCFARLRAARCVQGHSRNASSGARSRDGGIGDSTQLVQHVGGQVQHDSNADGSGAVQRRDAKVAAEP